MLDTTKIYLIQCEADRKAFVKEARQSGQPIYAHSALRDPIIHPQGWRRAKWRGVQWMAVGSSDLEIVYKQSRPLPW